MKEWINKYKGVLFPIGYGFGITIGLVIILLCAFKTEGEVKAQQNYYPTKLFRTPVSNVYKFSDNENNVDCYVSEGFHSNATIACVRKKNKE